MALLQNIESSHSGKSPLKSETKGSMRSIQYYSPLQERPEERVRLLDQLDNKPLSFYRKKRVIYINDFTGNICTRINYGEVKHISNAFFQDFYNFYSFNEIILPLPTPNRVNFLRYEVQPISKEYTDEPNTLVPMLFGNQRALLLDPIGGLIKLFNIPPDLERLNLEIAKLLNPRYIEVSRKINLLSIRYRSHPLVDVYDESSVEM